MLNSGPTRHFAVNSISTIRAAGTVKGAEFVAVPRPPGGAPRRVPLRCGAARCAQSPKVVSKGMENLTGQRLFFLFLSCTLCPYQSMTFYSKILRTESVQISSKIYTD